MPIMDSTPPDVVKSKASFQFPDASAVPFVSERVCFYLD